MKLVVDCGRSYVKVVAQNREFRFPSWVSKNTGLHFYNHEKYNYSLELDGEKVLLGRFAEYEGSARRKPYYESKAVPEFLWQVLCACYEAGIRNQEVEIATLIPISSYKLDAEEVDKVKRLLQKTHYVTINGEDLYIKITQVHVTLEGASSFYVSDRYKELIGLYMEMYDNHGEDYADENIIKQITRIVDAGAKTVNYASFAGLTYINSQSGTMQNGWETTRDVSPEVLGANIASEVSKDWDKDDYVVVCGGRANDLVEPLGEFFHTVVALPDSQFSNSRGLYERIKG